MKIGLYFGSFNPIHLGHLIVAESMLELSDIDKIWFVVSPQNPFKTDKDLLHHFDRYDMVQSAIEGNPRFAVTDIEFNLPKPSYTITTLDALAEKFPDKEFCLVLGGDNLSHLHKWQEADRLLKEYKIYVYPRPKAKEGPLDNHLNVIQVDAPMLDISATFVRNQLKLGKSVRYLLPENVEGLVRLKGWYR